MKKYMQPTSEVLTLHMESVIAASVPVHNEGTDAAPLSKKKEDMWGHKDMWK